MSVHSGPSLVEVAIAALILTLGILVTDKAWPPAGHDDLVPKALASQAEELRRLREPPTANVAGGLAGRGKEPELAIAIEHRGSPRRSGDLTLRSYDVGATRGGLVVAKLTLTTLRSSRRELDAKVGL